MKRQPQQREDHIVDFVFIDIPLLIVSGMATEILRPLSDAHFFLLIRVSTTVRRHSEMDVRLPLPRTRRHCSRLAIARHGELCGVESDFIIKERPICEALFDVGEDYDSGYRLSGATIACLTGAGSAIRFLLFESVYFMR